MTDSIIREDLRRSVREGINDTHPVSFVERMEVIPLSSLKPDGERLRATEARTLNGFLELFEKILNEAKTIDGLEYDIVFTSEHPGIDSKLPCITVEIVKRSPYSANGRIEYSPRFMDEWSDPESPGGLVQNYLRRQTNLVRMTVWAKQGKEKNRFAEWLEDKFFEYLWGIQWGGVGHPCLFEGRGEDYTATIQNQRIHAAPLIFSITTSKITQRRETSLRRISTNIGIVIPGLS